VILLSGGIIFSILLATLGYSYHTFKEIELIEIGEIKVDSFFPLEVGVPIKVKNSNWYDILFENLEVTVFSKDTPITTFKNQQIINLKSNSTTRLRLKSSPEFTNLISTYLQNDLPNQDSVQVEVKADCGFIVFRNIKKIQFITYINLNEN